MVHKFTLYNNYHQHLDHKFTLYYNYYQHLVHNLLRIATIIDNWFTILLCTKSVINSYLFCIIDIINTWFTIVL
jgi:hypothetical protein